MSGDPPALNGDNKNRNGNAEDWRGGARVAGDIYINSDFSRGDRMITAVHEAQHIAGKDDVVDATEILHSEYRAFQQLPSSLRAGATRHSDRFFHLWGAGYGSHPVRTQEPRQ